MKNLLFITLVGTSFLFAGCTKCNCNEDWDASVTYKKNDFVWYNGSCWKADGQGKSIEPGPWLQNGNDIWHECSE